MDDPAEVIRSLIAENQVLKIQILQYRTEVRQLELATLIVNSRLLVLRKGERLATHWFETEPDDRPWFYRDDRVEVYCSTISRALDIREPGKTPMVLIGYDGSMEHVTPSFHSLRAHVRNLETSGTVAPKYWK